MKVGVYCGSFSPVHNGHLTIAREAVNQGLVDKVLIVATEPYWKKEGLLPLNERIKMLQFFESDNLLVETKNNRISTTYEGFLAIGKEHPDWELSLILGADNLPRFNEWYKYDKLLTYNFILVKRAEIGSEWLNNKMKEFNKTNYLILNIPTIDISSTYIREHINEPELLKDKLDSRVYEYLKNNNLYNIEDIHVESEKKVLIKEQKYKEIIINEHIGFNDFIRQINNYYSNDKGILRIRKFADRDECQITYKHKEKEDLVEEEIKSNRLTCEQDLKNFADRKCLGEVSYLGSLDTLRAVIKMEYGELCIDKNIYAGVTDYELEFELYDANKENFKEFYDFLDKYDIEFVENKVHKFNRFLKRIGR